jgi:hypothetical protein
MPDQDSKWDHGAICLFRRKKGYAVKFLGCFSGSPSSSRPEIEALYGLTLQYPSREKALRGQGS